MTRSRFTLILDEDAAVWDLQGYPELWLSCVGCALASRFSFSGGFPGTTSASTFQFEDIGRKKNYLLWLLDNLTSSSGKDGGFHNSSSSSQSTTSVEAIRFKALSPGLASFPGIGASIASEILSDFEFEATSD